MSTPEMETLKLFTLRLWQILGRLPHDEELRSLAQDLTDYLLLKTRDMEK